MHMHVLHLLLATVLGGGRGVEGRHERRGREGGMGEGGGGGGWGGGGGGGGAVQQLHELLTPFIQLRQHAHRPS